MWESASRSSSDARCGLGRYNGAIYIRRCAMEKWECTVCGWIYDPAKGDPSQGISARTAFEDLPEDWLCPECGAPKDMFELVG